MGKPAAAEGEEDVGGTPETFSDKNVLRAKSVGGADGILLRLMTKEPA
jgi:hypothetical protein